MMVSQKGMLIDMKNGKRDLFIGVVIGLLPLACPMMSRPVVAQPEIIDPGDVTDMVTGESPEQRNGKAWKALRAQMKDAEAGEPAKAVAAYTEFLNTHARLNPDQGVDIYKIIGQLYADGLKDSAKAIATYDAGLKKYGADPSMASLLGEKARLLLRNKKGAEAAATLEEAWPRASNTYAHMAEPLLHAHSDVLRDLKQPDERIKVLQRGMAEFPRLLSGQTPNYEWTYSDLMATLQEQKRAGEALSWARLRFATCPYESGALDRATRMLAQAWTAAEPERKALLEFGKAQKDAAVANPLAKVPMPTLDDEVIQSVSARFKGKPLEERNIWRIMSGTPQGLAEAMAESRALCESKDKAEATKGALEACRVFKAGDLNLLRATAFLQYLKTRTGDDPTAAFIREQKQAQPAA